MEKQIFKFYYISKTSYHPIWLFIHKIVYLESAVQRETSKTYIVTNL